MDRIYVGKGVFRSEQNTQLFEVFTDDQMDLMKTGQEYEYIRKNKIKGGFHGIKVLAARKKINGGSLGPLKFENIELISREQAAVIRSIVANGNAPEVVYEGGVEVGVKHDYSRDYAIASVPPIPKERGSGTNENAANINPGTGEPYDDDDHEPLDEGFVGEDDVESDGHSGNGAEGSAEDGDAVAGIEPKKSGKAAKPKSKPSKSKPSGK